MKRIIQFQVTKGKKFYTAEGVNLPIVTQGKTLDELAENIKEAVELHCEGEKLEDLGIASSPSLLLNYELIASSAK